MAVKKESEQHKPKQKEKVHTESNSKSKSADESTNFDVHQKAEELVETLQGNLNEIEPEKAFSLIQEWHGFLNQSKDTSVSELANELKGLQKRLKGNKVSESDVSEMLLEIGEKTSEFAANAEKDAKQILIKLGKQLRNTGTQIAKAEEKEYHDQLDRFLEKSNDQELTDIKPEEATGIIDFWYDALNKSEDKQFKEIASNLKSLKQSLSKDNAKAESIAKALSQISEQTIAVASEAPRGFKGMLQKVGKQLAITSDSIKSSKS